MSSQMSSQMSLSGSLTNSDSQNSSPSHGSSSAQFNALKRALASKEAEVEDLKTKKARHVDTPKNRGRCFRKAVSLYEGVRVLMDAWDRVDLQKQGLVERGVITDDEQRKLVRDHESFELLIKLIPTLKDMLDDTDWEQNDHTADYLAKVQKGGNEAQSDNIGRIKAELAHWLNTFYSPSVPFTSKDRKDRGLQNDITGCLLCPIDHDWSDLNVRANIRSAIIDIRNDYFLRALYPENHMLPANGNIEHNFLRSSLLVKTYCAIYTSPASAEAFGIDPAGGIAERLPGADGRRASRNNVAQIMGLDGVTSRTIAYAAVMLIFNLTNAVTWVSAFNGFNFRAFYNFVVDFFVVGTDAAQLRINRLLDWWTLQVFPDAVQVAVDTNTSRNRLEAVRLALEPVV